MSKSELKGSSFKAQSAKEKKQENIKGIIFKFIGFVFGMAIIVIVVNHYYPISNIDFISDIDKLINGSDDGEPEFKTDFKY